VARRLELIEGGAAHRGLVDLEVASVARARSLRSTGLRTHARTASVATEPLCIAISVP
jgi:hypothetical protein